MIYYRVSVIVLLLILVVQISVSMWFYSINKSSLDAVAAECLQYKATSAMIIDGVAYCGMTYMGNSYVGELEALRELSKK